MFEETPLFLVFILATHAQTYLDLSEGLSVSGRY